MGLIENSTERLIMKNIKLTLATILAIIIFIMAFTIATSFLTPGEKVVAEKTTPKTEAVLNYYRMDLIILEMESYEEITELYKARHPGKLEPGTVIEGFAEFTLGDTSKCIIIIPFAFRANFKNSHLGAFSTVGHELNHCIRGYFHEKDNTPKIITF